MLTSISGLGRGVRRVVVVLFLRGGMLLDFAVDRVAAQIGVVLFFLNTLGLELFVASAHVAGDRFAFRFGFSTFEYDNFAWHDGLNYLVDLAPETEDSEIVVLLAPAPSMVPRLPSLLRCRTAPSFSNRAWASTV